MNWQGDVRLLSPDIPIEFAGWRSSTYRLQQAGWELSAKQDMCSHYGVRLALRHSALQMFGLTSVIDIKELKMWSNGRYKGPPFYIQQMANNMRVMLHEDLTAFQPIDATPQIVENKIVCIEDLNIFKTLSKTKEIIVEPQNVNEILSMALQFQSPKQAELREKRRKNYKRFQRELHEFVKDVDIAEPVDDVIAQILV